MQEPERFFIEPKKEDYDRIINKLREGETVYLINEFYHTAIKVIPGTMDYEAKYKGGARYPLNAVLIWFVRLWKRPTRSRKSNTKDIKLHNGRGSGA
jgi:hypothetical protein